MSISIELNTKEINVIVCHNIIKMLKRRKVIEDVDETFNSIKDDINNKASIEFSLLNSTKCSIYIINSKVTSIAQGTPLDDFLSNNVDIHKIIIIKDPAKKVIKQINFEYQNTELFFEHEMLEDIPMKVFIPEHQLLNENEKAELLSKFNENELSIIYNTDTMSRYYGANVGDIFRIIRPSITSGKSIFYRRVMHGNFDELFS
jgi:hypothetical protein